MTTRPAWVNDELFPFESRFLEVAGARLHYIDEGEGPVFLALHGNPTWSFLYRNIVKGLRGQYRCIAVDYPGFGLSTAPAGYAYTVAEHARVIARFIEELGLRDITLMGQDWGGPIGFWVATQYPDRFSAFVVGNTWAWPLRDDRSVSIFSKIMGSERVGGLLVKRADAFVNLAMRGAMRRRQLTPTEREMYKRPHPSPESRLPVHVMPKELLAASDWLAEIEQGLKLLVDKPMLLVWGDRDPGFRKHQLRRWERAFPNHQTHILHGAGHYIQEEAPDEIVAVIKEWAPTPS